jgi:hypothetical protein
VSSPCSSIPIEQAGGPGTAGGHWDEPDGPGGLEDSRSVLRNGTSLNFRNELMTGWANTPMWMGAFTCMALEDIGFDCVACVDSTDCASGYACQAATDWLPGVCVLETSSPTTAPTAPSGTSTGAPTATPTARPTQVQSAFFSVLQDDPAGTCRILSVSHQDSALQSEWPQLL